MGKRQVHVVRVPKWVTCILLALTSAGMLVLYRLLSQHAYVRPTASTLELLLGAAAAARAGTLTSATLIAWLWPVAANLLLFVPWGFLLFIVIDSPQRPRSTTYLITVAGGILFAGAIQVWDMFTPLRVTTASDAIANGVGTFCGALLGHLRKRVRILFEH